MALLQVQGGWGVCPKWCVVLFSKWASKVWGVRHLRLVPKAMCQLMPKVMRVPESSVICWIVGLSSTTRSNIQKEFVPYLFVLTVWDPFFWHLCSEWFLFYLLPSLRSSSLAEKSGWYSAVANPNDYLKHPETCLTIFALSGCTFSLSELSKFRGDTLWDGGPGGVFQAQRNWCLSLLGRRKIKSSACKRNIYNLWSSAILQHTNQIHSRLTWQSHDLLSFLATTILRPETNLLQWDNQNDACISNSVPFTSIYYIHLQWFSMVQPWQLLVCSTSYNLWIPAEVRGWDRQRHCYILNIQPVAAPHKAWLRAIFVA